MRQAKSIIFAACIVMCGAGVPALAGAAEPSGLAGLLSPQIAGQGAAESLLAIRKTLLRDTARTLGSQMGMGDRSREIVAATESMSGELDARYRFNELLLGSGFLPPVIDDERDVVALGDRAYTVAQRVVRELEPIRSVAVAPSWRSYLYIGLQPKLKPALPQNSDDTPKTEVERQFWDAEIRMAYEKGREAAQKAFDNNLARLDRTYIGMRRYYELYGRQMMTFPVLGQADRSVVVDGKVMRVGESTVMVTREPSFVGKADAWRPLGE